MLFFFIPYPKSTFQAATFGATLEKIDPPLFAQAIFKDSAFSHFEGKQSILALVLALKAYPRISFFQRVIVETGT